jgi:hypothetical protein
VILVGSYGGYLKKWAIFLCRGCLCRVEAAFSVVCVACRNGSDRPFAWSYDGWIAYVDWFTIELQGRRVLKVESRSPMWFMRLEEVRLVSLISVHSGLQCREPRCGHPKYNDLVSDCFFLCLMLR